MDTYILQQPSHMLDFCFGFSSLCRNKFILLLANGSSGFFSAGNKSESSFREYQFHYKFISIFAIHQFDGKCSKKKSMHFKRTLEIFAGFRGKENFFRVEGGSNTWLSKLFSGCPLNSSEKQYLLKCKQGAIFANTKLYFFNSLNTK